MSISLIPLSSEMRATWRQWRRATRLRSKPSHASGIDFRTEQRGPRITRATNDTNDANHTGRATRAADDTDDADRDSNRSSRGQEARMTFANLGLRAARSTAMVNQWARAMSQAGGGH